MGITALYLYSTLTSTYLVSLIRCARQAGLFRIDIDLIFSRFVRWKLIFLVATALSTDISSTHKVMNISGKEYGYIVSHLQYELYGYYLSQNNSLTLTGLDFKRVEIVLEQIDVYNDSAGSCVDYLLISTLDKICGSTPSSLYINSKPLVSEITFIFKTTSEQHGKGFWLSYRGICFFD